MKIVKKYFDQMQKEIAEAEEYRKTFGREESAEYYNDGHIDNMMKKILLEAREAEKKVFTVTNNKKEQIFEEAAKDALFIAKLMSLNIEINTDDPAYGKIILVSDCFFPPGGEDQDIHIHFAKLFIHADIFCIDESDGRIRLNFWFPLRDEIRIQLQ